jgi:hypothetical protein
MRNDFYQHPLSAFLFLLYILTRGLGWIFIQPFTFAKNFEAFTPQFYRMCLSSARNYDQDNQQERSAPIKISKGQYIAYDCYISNLKGSRFFIHHTGQQALRF